jgi:hypothetical protein
MKLPTITLFTFALLGCSTFAQQPQATVAPAARPHRNVAPPPPANAAPQVQPHAWHPPAASSPQLNTPRNLGGSNSVRPIPNYTGRFNTDAVSRQRVPGWMQRPTAGERPDFSNSAARTPTNFSRDTLPAPTAQPTRWSDQNRNWAPRTGSSNWTGTGNSSGTTSRDPNWRQRNPNWRDGNRNWNSGNRTGSGDSRSWNGNFHDAYGRYDHRHHDRDWWRHHHDRIILINRGYYYWDAGWWYPAWGYDPAAEYYAYDGPIYGYDGLPPDQVIANVQTALQQQGYYFGMIDGQLGPITRQALAAWQRDHGLAITTVVDYATLASLGFG